MGRTGDSSIPTPAYLGSGLFLASFLMVASPTPSLGGGFASEGFLVGSRVALFIVLVLATVLAVASRGRLARLAGRPGPLVAVVAIQFLCGFGYPLAVHGLAPDALLTVDLLAQALVLPYLGLVWTGAYALLSKRQANRTALASLAGAVLVLAALQVLPVAVSAILMRALPLATLLVLPIIRSAGEPTLVGTRSAPDETCAAQAALGNGRQAARPSWQFLLGVFCALTASNVLAGAAETGGFLSWTTMLAGYGIAVAVVALGVFLRERGILSLRQTTLGIIGVLAVCYAASGLVMGGVEDIGDLPKLIQHISVISMELAVCAVAWLILLETARGSAGGLGGEPGAPRPDASGSAAAATTAAITADLYRTVGLGLVAINGGKAVGSIVGMLVPLNPAALSIIALIAFVPAMFFLAADWYRGDSAGASPAPAAAASPTSGADGLVGLTGAETASVLDRLCAAGGLSPREREVLELWAAGHRLDYVADRLCISKNTAKTHVGHIYKKIGVANREELLQLIRRP